MLTKIIPLYFLKSFRHYLSKLVDTGSLYKTKIPRLNKSRDFCLCLLQTKLRI